DVNTMIERLVARLETTPGDVKGWQMLGWSYFHTGRHKQAAAALARALELDPSSEDLKLAYQTASAKAAEGDGGGAAAPSPVASAGRGADRPTDETHAAPAATPQRGEYDAAIRAMVDGLAARLESAPRDVEGWTRLMRSRV